MPRRILAFITGLILVAPTLAHAQAAGAPYPPGLTTAFGNTVRGTFPDGQAQRYWLKADGNWAGQGRTGRHNEGHWEYTGEEVCLTNQRRRTACIQLPASWMGEKRQSSARFRGVPFLRQNLTLELVPGIERYTPVAR